MGAVLAIVFGLLFVGGLVLTFLFYEKDKKVNISVIGAAMVAFSMMLLFILLPWGFHTIKTGEVAVVKVWGEAKEIKTAGIHYDFYISTEYDKYDTKTQEINTVIEAYSLDAQSMTASLVVQFNIQSNKVLEINKNFGALDILTERLQAVAVEKAKVILSQKSATDLIANRSSLSGDVESLIKENIGQYYVDVTIVVLTDITFSDAFENIVEQKMIAEQKKLQAEYDKETAIVQAEQAFEVAKLQADSAIATAEGDKQAKILAAEAEAEAIKGKSIEVARMLGFDIIETAVGENIVYTIDFTGKTTAEIAVISEYLKYIEYLSVWNGVLPTTLLEEDSATIMVTP